MVVDPVSAIGFGLKLGGAIFGSKAKKELLGQQFALQQKMIRQGASDQKRMSSERSFDLQGRMKSTMGATGARMGSGQFGALLADQGSDFNFEQRMIANQEQNAIEKAAMEYKAGKKAANAELFANVGSAVMSGGATDFKHYLGKGMEGLGGLLTGEGDSPLGVFQYGPDASAGYTS
jgi:hypothetical protein